MIASITAWVIYSPSKLGIAFLSFMALYPVIEDIRGHGHIKENKDDD